MIKCKCQCHKRNEVMYCGACWNEHHTASEKLIVENRSLNDALIRAKNRTQELRKKLKEGKRMWGVYPITSQGNPQMPIFVAKKKYQIKWYLEYMHKQWEWDKPENFYIAPIKINIPKIGAKRAKSVVINQITFENVIEIKQ